MRALWTLALGLLVSGCATAPESGDWPLQWPAESARLRIIDASGQGLQAFGGAYLALPGYVFLEDSISLHPGTHRIQFACPGTWDWQMISGFVPSVTYHFEAGRSYELHCVEGQPEIRLASLTD